MSKKHRLHYKNLYALRFFAFMLIFAYNAFLATTYNGRISGTIREITEHFAFIGLEFYFTLTAFLITALALRERKNYGRFNLYNFYIRRFVRIMPLYLVILFLTFLGTPLIVESFHLKHSLTELPSVMYFLGFINNYYIMLQGAEFVPFLVVLWSLAVIVQFNLVWGVVMRYFMDHIRLIAWIMVVAGVVFRFIALARGGFESMNTLAYLSDFGVGALVALELRSKGVITERIRNMGPKQLMSTYVFLGIMPAVGFMMLGDSIITGLEALVFPAFFTFLILENTATELGLFRLRKKKILTDLGKMSYGLMMFHSIVLAFVFSSVHLMNLDLNPLIMVTFIPAIALIGTVIGAYMSWNYFEKPLLRFRRPFKKS